MSTLLQRMARRARESPVETTPHIDPVLASSFWPGAGTNDDGAIEEHREREARAPARHNARAAAEPLDPFERFETLEPRAPSVPIETAHTGEIAPVRAEARSHTAARKVAAQEPDVVARTTSKVKPTAQASMQGIASALPGHDRPAKIEPLLDATPVPAAATREPSRRESAARSRTPARPAQPREAVTVTHYAQSPAESPRAPNAPDAAPPTITITFGRVEVRQASAPPAPTRAPFRPAVSLEAFLRRGGGNTR